MPSSRAPVEKLLSAGVLSLFLGWAPAQGSEPMTETPATEAFASPVAACVVDPEPPEYYEFELIRTTRVPGTGRATKRRTGRLRSVWLLGPRSPRSAVEE